MIESTSLPGSREVGDWASEIASGPGVPGRRRDLTAIGTAMVAGPLAMTAWFLVEPSVLPREDARVFLESVATSPARYLAGTVLLGLAGALSIPAAVGFARLIRPRLPKLGAVIGFLMALSGLGLCAQIGFRAMVWSMVEPGSVPASSVETYATFQTAGLFDYLVAPGLVFGGLSTLLAVGSLLRIGVVPRWAPVAMVVGMVLASGEFADPVTIFGAAIGAVANVWLARALLARG